MSESKKIQFSVLDLAPIVEGATAADALRNTLDLAQHAEKWGYHRYWLAEHHNMPGIASSATSVVIGYVAGGTSTIRVGAGGIMLPNHAPLVIAEQFGTLESLYPGRIDLGLGRAPGTDRLTIRALRRDPVRSGEDFPEQLAELRAYFDPSLSSKTPPRVRAVPGEGLEIPIWLLGSSDYSARLAGELGLPFAFATHFSPLQTMVALEVYRNHFQPSKYLEEPYVMVCLNIIAADEEEEAYFLTTSLEQQFLAAIRNNPQKLQPPIEKMEEMWNEYEKALVYRQIGGSIIGNPNSVEEKIIRFLEKTKADELMMTAQIYDHQARLRSFEIVAEVHKKLFG